MKAGWEVRPLKEVCDRVSTGPFGSLLGKKDYVGSGVPVVNPIDMVEGIIRSISIKCVSEETALKLSSYRMQSGDIVVARRGELGRCAKVTDANSDWLCGTGSFYIRPSASILVDYLERFISSPQAQLMFEAASTGATMPNISNKTLSNLPIPLPPLEEQKRIVAVLDAAFEGLTRARTHIETNLQNARELFEAQRKFQLSNLSADWQQLTIDQICIVERGSSPRPIKRYVTTDPNGVNWIKIGDTKVGSKYVRSTKEKITALGAEKSRRVEIGDFILTNSMTYGRPYIMGTDGYIHDGWFVLRLKDEMDSNFLFHALSSEVVQEQFRNLAAGAVVKNISGDLVKKTVVPVPPVNKQIELAKLMDAASATVDELEAHYHAKFQDLDDLRQSLLQKAFAGELT